MLTGISLRRRLAAAGLRRVFVQAYHASTFDNTNRLEDGGTAALSPAFLENKQCMDGVVRHLHELVGQAILGGGQKAIARHRSRGKMLPRDRIAALLDPGSPFLELSQLAGHQLYGIERWLTCFEWTYHIKKRVFINVALQAKKKCQLEGWSPELVKFMVEQLQ